MAIIRVSGPAAFPALTALDRSTSKAPLVPMQAVLRDLWCPRSDSRLDQALVLPFKGPRSYTGEDVVELHVHGSPAVVRGTLEALGRCEGLVPAGPGEFSKRAFLNGKMDLTEVEAVCSATCVHPAPLALLQSHFAALDAVPYLDWIPQCCPCAMCLHTPLPCCIASLLPAPLPK